MTSTTHSFNTTLLTNAARTACSNPPPHTGSVPLYFANRTPSILPCPELPARTSRCLGSLDPCVIVRDPFLLRTAGLLLLPLRSSLRLHQKVGDKTLLRWVARREFFAHGKGLCRLPRPARAHERKALAQKHHPLGLRIPLQSGDLEGTVVVRERLAMLARL